MDLSFDTRTYDPTWVASHWPIVITGNKTADDNLVINWSQYPDRQLRQIIFETYDSIASVPTNNQVTKDAIAALKAAVVAEADKGYAIPLPKLAAKNAADADYVAQKKAQTDALAAAAAAAKVAKDKADMERLAAAAAQTAVERQAADIRKYVATFGIQSYTGSDIAAIINKYGSLDAAIAARQKEERVTFITNLKMNWSGLRWKNPYVTGKWNMRQWVTPWNKNWRAPTFIEDNVKGFLNDNFMGKVGAMAISRELPFVDQAQDLVDAYIELYVKNLESPLDYVELSQRVGEALAPAAAELFAAFAKYRIQELEQYREFERAKPSEADQIFGAVVEGLSLAAGIVGSVL